MSEQNENTKNEKIEGELIYNEEKGSDEMQKLFDDEAQEYDTYEIEFKINIRNKQGGLYPTHIMADYKFVK